MSGAVLQYAENLARTASVLQPVIAARSNSAYNPIYLSFYPSIYRIIYLSIQLSIYLPMCLHAAVGAHEARNSEQPWPDAHETVWTSFVEVSAAISRNPGSTKAITGPKTLVPGAPATLA